MQMLSWPEFLQLIKSDVKMCGVPHINTSQDITKKAVELANEKGGYLILGFDRYTFQLPGCVFDSKWLNGILTQEIKPALNFEIVGFIRSNKRLFVVKIAEGEKKPYSAVGSSEVQTTTPAKILTLENIAPEFVQKRQEACLKYLEERADITNIQYRELNGVSYKTAHNELSDLVAKNQLVQVGQGRTTKYVLAKNGDYLPAKEVSLFGDALDGLVSINNDSTSITEIRRAQNISAEHMNDHLIKLNP
ncbi:MAG: hypothetical protein LBJ25_00360 [Candidatus Margulisbacteria bacterium]|jgi:predicted HTH transcriptional regulator|nr:hypothetical protein [Candidatus Margulisiibacteriota bacterium]